MGYGLVLMMLVRGLFAESFQTPSASMEPTLTPEDRILVNKIGGASSLQRGDLVVLDGTRTFADRAAGPGSDQSSVVGRIRGWIASPLIHPNESDYVKRVVGLPGDHVVCCEARGPLTANDIAVEEPYLHPGDRPSDLTFDVTVAAARNVDDGRPSQRLGRFTCQSRGSWRRNGATRRCDRQGWDDLLAARPGRHGEGAQVIGGHTCHHGRGEA